MNTYDVVMVVVVGGATLFGACKGMAWQLASLTSLVLSYFVALKFSASMAVHINQPAPWNRFLAMLALYLGTSLAVWLIFRVVAGVIDRVRLKEFDRQVGALFGAFKGFLLCIAITFFAVSLAPQMRSQILTSKSGLLIARVINNADAVMPPEIHELLDPYLDRVGDKLNPDAMPENTIQQAEQPEWNRQVRATEDAASELMSWSEQGMDAVFSELPKRLIGKPVASDASHSRHPARAKGVFR